MTVHNHDGSYFKITSLTMASLNDSYSQDVISLSIEEADKEMAKGTISFHDKGYYYSRILRPGVKMRIEWGIHIPDYPPVFRVLDEVMVSAPSGEGSSDGKIIYNCSFMCMGMRGGQARTWFDSGTRYKVVFDAMTRIGVVQSEISFAKENEALSKSTMEMQAESDFRFLVRLSDDYRCAFRMGYGKAGLVASFINYDLLGKSVFPALISGAMSSLVMKYGTVDANVLKYSWSDDSMSAANGAGTNIIWGADGNPQMVSYIVEDEKTVAYRLDVAKLASVMEAEPEKNLTALVCDFMKVDDFALIKDKYFTREVLTTAPQGKGITIQASLMGDPLVTNGLVATFGLDSGFPDRIGGKERTWWVRRATHDLSSSGYFTSVEIIDAFVNTPTGMKL